MSRGVVAYKNMELSNELGVVAEELELANEPWVVAEELELANEPGVAAEEPELANEPEPANPPLEQPRLVGKPPLPHPAPGCYPKVDFRFRVTLCQFEEIRTLYSNKIKV